MWHIIPDKQLNPALLQLAQIRIAQKALAYLVSKLVKGCLAVFEDPFNTVSMELASIK